MTFVNHFDISLWQACDSYYHQHQALYLSLQDDYQINVNLLMLATWLDKQDYLLSQQDWMQLQDETHLWEERVLLPYRKLRKLSKNSLAIEEYQQMLDVELMLERKSQGLILHKLKQLSHFGESSNLATYLGLFNLNRTDYPSLES
ncbi:TIGR02444 family protein [Shewanella eurypsychrophilus]|uniref:TIGR02444 family protein n=1 Tax=Shewanella eurypsychrophilus TaxID=2593656 RepID=A0ABX6VA95_9GAMM|nr:MULTISPECIES: TIGR02444 family protein [Shewanella]QFU24399.1 TIGR02444 family protein [Shewanella sp. YLB-09]QPG59599.1 TIGR02444 family protein [Shewanella eurypsychrophilus]